MLPVSSISYFLCLGALANAQLTWNHTQFLFVFGDSYTATGMPIFFRPRVQVLTSLTQDSTSRLV
jgi:hypothetical protein